MSQKTHVSCAHNKKHKQYTGYHFAEKFERLMLLMQTFTHLKKLLKQCGNATWL